MIADDNLDGAQALSALLSGMGHAVATAANGPEAVLLARDFEPDLVILDLDMPLMDGFETARVLRNREASLTIAALTGLPPGFLSRDALDACFDWLFVKPIGLDDLQRLLDDGD